MPRGGKTRPCKNPLKQSPTVKVCCCCDDIYSSGKPFRLDSGLRVGIAEEVGIVKTAFAHKSLRVNREPSALAEIENVPVVHVPMKYTNILR